ncbi:hypothetical protein ACGFJ7_19580 [Actinoplanes sp. NPDC048988]|uniref:hypothetical protein n=1 Tax=Actinoplanes sp. NPDC048988 TaxID=3363901 RepID=UPI003713079C
MSLRISRRVVLRTGAAAVVAGAALPTAAARAQAPSKPRRETSANGWPIQATKDVDSQVWTRTVSGTGLSVPVSIGDAETILLHVVRRFHYEIEQIPSIDLTGWQPAAEVAKGRPESNLASGSAVRIRPGSRAKGGFFPLQELVLRDILADCEGVVRWGGDDEQVDESLFYIALGPRHKRVRTLADRFRGFERKPGAGAGVSVDFLAKPRRSRADALARAQRTR